MAYEIELKAHVAAEQVPDVKVRLMAVPGIRYIGETDKFDIYWSKTPDGEPVFRTRRQMTSEGPDDLFTAKPHKKKSAKGNVENK